jgi:streptogramin lyase
MTAIVFGSLSASYAAAADFQYPLAVVAAGDGTVYVADRNLPGIWKINGDKTEIYFQASKKFRTPLNAVRCLAIDRKGRLLAGDSATREVYRFDKAGKPQPLTSGGIGIPMAIAVNSAGDLFVADLEVHRIWKVPSEGGKPEEFAAVPAPRGLAIDAKDRLWIVSHGKNQLLRLDKQGKLSIIVKGRPFRFPHQVVLAEDETAYVSDGYSKAIWKVSKDGRTEKWIDGKPLVNPVGIALRGKTLLIADPRANSIFEAAADGSLTTLVSGPKPKK